MDTKNPQKSPTFLCNKCKYKTDNKKDYSKHLLTRKHKMDNNGYYEDNEKIPTWKCVCGKIYKFKQGLYKHKKTCVNLSQDDKTCSNNIIMEIVKQNQSYIFNNQEFKEIIMEQNKYIIEQQKQSQELQKTILTIAQESKIIQNNTTNNTKNNFNMNFFLHEQCKDALNIMDFVNTLQVHLKDLENVGQLGYAEGISKIFIRGLKELDIFKRPIHCSDLKRETMYVKDKNEWEKDNDDKAKIKLAIKYIAHKNTTQIPSWVKENPCCKNSDSKKNDQYLHIINKSMGGIDEIEDEKNYNKIIKNVAKEVKIS